ncbi:MAG TPA: zf-HC2 domain-containing protein [Chloroflexota bacterium]|nr:zf-HC2 domain-containing protein [Chloroflexota bacterium]
MNCESDGTLRAYLDAECEPAVAARIDAHLAECPDCEHRIAELQLLAKTVDSLLSAFPHVEIVPDRRQGAWDAVESRLLERAFASPKSSERYRVEEVVSGANSSIWRNRGQREIPTMIRNTVMRHSRSAVAALLAVVLVAGVLAMPAGQAAAVSLLSIFRVQNFAVVTYDPGKPFEDMDNLERVGTLEISDRDGSNATTVESVAQASERVGFTVRTPSTLPAEVSGEPRISVVRESRATFTVDRAKAEAYLREQGEANPSIPAELDGTRLVVTVPARAVLMYGDTNGQPVLVIGQIPSPTVATEGGASLEELRTFLLGLPGLPEDTVAQLKAIDDWTTTMPIPLPRDRAIWRDVSVNGGPGLIVADQTKAAGSLIWQSEGMVYGIAGQLGEDELLDIARGIR